MKLFRFCRQGLTALPVFFMLISCDKLLPTSGNGGLVPVKIRAVSVKGYGEASATRSAGGEKRIVGQTIVQDLGDGMLAEITVEEDVSALRDDPTPKKLGGGVKFRIIALKSGSLHDYADYTMPESEPSGGALTPDEGSEALECEVGDTYDFICYSYNSSDALPDWSDGNLSALSVDNSKDLLYWSDQNNTIKDGEALSINMTQQLAKVTLKINTGGKTITAVDGSKISLDARPGSFNLKNGEFSSSSGNIYFTNWTGTGSQEVTGTRTFIPKESEDYTLYLTEGAVTMGGDKSSKASSATLSNSTFEAGKSYTIQIKPKLPKFAGSNIYWDGEKLTFDLYGTTTHQYYQGVFFRWGSLVGISPAPTNGSNNYDPSNTVLYAPDNVSNRTWKVTTGSSNTPTWSDWDAIPSYYGTSMTNGETLLSKGDEGFGDSKGDICYYINSDYRMPTLDETTAHAPYYTSFTANDITNKVDKTDGTYDLTNASTTFAGLVFPASGYRYYSSGELKDVGNVGFYWSGAAYVDGGGNNNNARFLLFNASGAGNSPAGRIYAFPVRCVKN